MMCVIHLRQDLCIGNLMMLSGLLVYIDVV
jgi:hypothetical protein